MDPGLPCSSFPTDYELLPAIRSTDRILYNKAGKCIDSFRQSFINYFLKNFDEKASGTIKAEFSKDLQDYYQSALLIFLNHIRKESSEYDVEDNPFRGIRNYIFNIGKHLYFDSLRIKIRDLKMKKRFREMEELQTWMTQFEHNFAEERTRELKNAMQTLKDNCLELIRLRFTDGLTVREIATNKNIPENTVAQQLLRCREQLKKQLTP